MNRIPVNVNHNNNETAGESSQQKFASSSEYRSSSANNSSSQQRSENTYNMRNMNDETERIRSRMREFEEHCKRVREQAFANRGGVGTTTTTTTTGSPFFHQHDFNNNNIGDQRVPSANFDTSPSKLGSLGSSMHRSSIEDNADGTKKYRIEFDIGDFDQNELYIGTNGKSLVVKGDRELKAGSATETKTFNRELTLPDYVDINRMSAFLLNNVAPAVNNSGTNQFR